VSAPLVEEAPGECNRRNTWQIKERVTNIRIEVSTFMMRVPYIDAGFTYTIPLSAVGRSPPQGLQPLHLSDRYVSGTALSAPGVLFVISRQVHCPSIVHSPYSCSHHNSLTHSAAVTRNMSNEHLCRGGPEDGKQFGCRLTRVQLKEAGVGIFDDCPKCNHPLAFHPAGPQGEGRSSCQLIHHRCCDLKLSLGSPLISSHRISSHHLVRVFL
jgi:hypothetical protein